MHADESFPKARSIRLPSLLNSRSAKGNCVSNSAIAADFGKGYRPPQRCEIFRRIVLHSVMN